MSDFESILHQIRHLNPSEKQRIFEECREFITIHPIEKEMNIRAEVILEAIHRASDLTKRGIRGVVAETTFLLDVLPTAKGWNIDEIKGTEAYDAKISRRSSSVRIQVKMQRSITGSAMFYSGGYAVEVQRTRTGTKDGVSTRPYRFDEFDLLAVCMRPSTRNWHAFMYIPASYLIPNPDDTTKIKTMQPLPPHPEDNQTNSQTRPLSRSNLRWTHNLSAALKYFSE